MAIINATRGKQSRLGSGHVERLQIIVRISHATTQHSIEKQKWKR